MNAFVSIMNSARIAWLKGRARKHYKAYRKATADLPCGAFLAGEMSGTVASAKSKFNTIMDKLAKIDPLTPVTRL